MEFKKLKLSRCKIKSTELEIFNQQEQDLISTLTPYPIILEQKNNDYMVVYGFQKYRAYTRHDKNYIPAYIIKNISFLDKLILICRYQRAQRELFPCEIGQIIALLKKHDISNKLVATEIADALGINRGIKLIEQYHKLTQIPNYINDFLMGKTDSLKIWSRFVGRAEKIFKNIIEKASPSLSELLEIEKNLFELSRRENKNIDELAEELDLFLLIENNDIRAIRNRIKEKRYPLITKHRDQVNQCIQKLNLPNNVSVSPDQSFETKTIKISSLLRDPEDLDRLIRAVSDKKNISIIKNIFKIL